MRVIPKLKNMTEDQLKEWEEKMRELESQNINKDLTTKINTGRGWIF